MYICRTFRDRPSAEHVVLVWAAACIAVPQHCCVMLSATHTGLLAMQYFRRLCLALLLQVCGCGGEVEQGPKVLHHDNIHHSAPLAEVVTNLRRSTAASL
jgi:hypothetical protein